MESEKEKNGKQKKKEKSAQEPSGSDGLPLFYHGFIHRRGDEAVRGQKKPDGLEKRSGFQPCLSG
jgi:hypothetical protein